MAGRAARLAADGRVRISGGTTGNLSALVAARQFARNQRGQHPVGQWRLACAAQAHSSVQAAASVLDAEVVIVPENERGQLTGEALQSALTRSHDVFAVVASAGTTNAGIIDDLTGIADVCERYGIWMHVDGAYGGAALAAPSVRHLFAGIERADSFIVDPHKWLFATYDCCALLYRQPELARAAHAQRAGYLDAIDREVWNPWDYGVHLTGEPAACLFGSALRRMAPTGTPRRSSKPWQRLGRWQTGSGPSLSCHWFGSQYCLWCCSSGRDGTMTLTGAGRGDSHSRARFYASRRGGKAALRYGWPSSTRRPRQTTCWRSSPRPPWIHRSCSSSTGATSALPAPCPLNFVDRRTVCASRRWCSERALLLCVQRARGVTSWQVTRAVQIRSSASLVITIS